MSKLPDSARKVLESAALAHLVTLNEDSSPQVACVWVGLDGDEIVCGHVPRLRKIENIMRDPRVALSLEGAEIGDHGLKDYLVIYGTATITEGGAPGSSSTSPYLSRSRRRLSADAEPIARVSPTSPSTGSPAPAPWAQQ